MNYPARWRSLVWAAFGAGALSACGSSEPSGKPADPPLIVSGDAESSAASSNLPTGDSPPTVTELPSAGSGGGSGQGGAGGSGQSGASGATTSAGDMQSQTEGSSNDTDSAMPDAGSAKGLADAGGSSADSTDVSSEPTSTEPTLDPAPFILGADVSIVLQDEYWGATFTDQGQPGDVLEILVNHGFNYVRLRTFVDPAAPGGYAEGEPEAWCDIAHTAQLAVRAKALGMGVLLDFHYSDTWADPGAQHSPVAWADYGIEQLEQAVYQYTLDSIEHLREAGALPEMVQVGNEITNGIAGVSRSNIAQFARVLRAGVKAVRDADPDILVMMHIERCHDLATSRAWLDGVLGQGVEFDVFAQSCYGDATGRDGQHLDGYHGGVEDWQQTFSALAQEYPQLRFAVAEYSSDKRALNDIVYNLPNRVGLGTFLWDTTRWYETHPIEPVFTTGAAWNDFVSIPEAMELYEQMAQDYGLR